MISKLVGGIGCLVLIGVVGVAFFGGCLGLGMLLPFSILIVFRSSTLFPLTPRLYFLAWLP